MTDRLKPCPLCDGEVEWKNGHIVCKECGLSFRAFSYDLTNKKWNTRKPIDRIVEQLEEEIEYCEKQVDEISATSFSIVNGLKRNIYIEKISAYRDAIIIVEEGGREYE